MNFVTFILLLILFVFFALVIVKRFRGGSKRFWALVITILVATAILYQLPHIYMEIHPSVFLLLLFLVVGAVVYLSARYFSR